MRIGRVVVARHLAFFVAGIFAIASLGFSSTGAYAQATPLTGAVNGAQGSVMEHATDDILREAIDDHNRTKAAANRPIPNFGSFATGRSASTTHDGYSSSLAAPFNRSVNFSSDERSAFGGLVYRFAGPQSGSRVSIGGYAGSTWLDVDLGGLAGVYVGNSTGSAEDTNTLGGVTTVYSVDNLYFAGAFTYFSGDGSISQTNGAFSPYSPKYATSGYLYNFAVGNSFNVATIGGAPLYFSPQAGFRRVEMQSDKFANQSATGSYQLNFESNVVTGALELFSVVTAGQTTIRPFVRLSAQRDVSFDNQELTYNAAGALVETVDFNQSANFGLFEGGVGVMIGNFNLSASGFTEWAQDRSTSGAKIGGRLDF